MTYQFIDRIKKTLIITEITYETDNNKTIATQIEIFSCPFNRIDKQNSYNLEMEKDAVKGKYMRLTLVSPRANNGFARGEMWNAERTPSLHWTRFDLLAVKFKSSMPSVILTTRGAN